MQVVIRADASILIGTGHLMRCLTLAGALRAQGAQVAFICRDLPGDLADLIKRQGFALCALQGQGEFETVLDAEQAAAAACFASKPDWLIVDHYDIDAAWERRLRPLVGRIMVIDDLADRSHDCDILLDQNLSDDMGHRYDGLTPSGCRRFFGPRHVLFRDEFIEARRTLRERDGVVHRLLLFFGGSDPTNETGKALQAVKELKQPQLALDVVVGSANPNGAHIESICATLPGAVFHRQVANMAVLMAQADLALGAGGTTTWERCFLGLPALIVVVAENQAEPARSADKAGVACLVGSSAEVSVHTLTSALRRALQQPGLLREMTSRCLCLMGQRSTPVNDRIMTCLQEASHES